VNNYEVKARERGRGIRTAAPNENQQAEINDF
jgi:hypothetical protein